MGYIHEAWKGTPSTLTTKTNARGQAVPSTADGGYTAASTARMAAQAAALNDKRAQLKALKKLGLDLFGGEAFAPLQYGLFGEHVKRVLRFVKSGENVGFSVLYHDGRMEAWSAVNGKPYERLVGGDDEHA